jgi:GntR family transcriptional regulator
MYSDIPSYVQIADIIRRQISNGELRAHDQIPSLTAIMQEHGVALGTAQKAIGVLKEEGLVVAVPGRGTFVTER